MAQVKIMPGIPANAGSTSRLCAWLSVVLRLTLQTTQIVTTHKNNLHVVPACYLHAVLVQAAHVILRHAVNHESVAASAGVPTPDGIRNSLNIAIVDRTIPYCSILYCALLWSILVYSTPLDILLYSTLLYSAYIPLPCVPGKPRMCFKPPSDSPCAKLYETSWRIVFYSLPWTWKSSSMTAKMRPAAL